MAEKIVVACAADNKYAVLAAVMLKSLCLSLTSHASVKVYLLNNGISDRRLQMLRSSVATESVELEILSVKSHDLRYGGLHKIPDAWRHTAWHRLLLPHLVPQQLGRLLYLDCDTLIQSDLSELFETSMGEHDVVAAVQDQRAYVVSCDWGGAISNWRELGMSEQAKYFNSGVLLMDLEKWRALDITKQVVDCTLENWEHVRWLDQYALNVVLHKSWLELPVCYNCFPEVSVSNPKIVHYVGRNPNAADYRGSFQNEWLAILDKTAWRGRRATPIPFSGLMPAWLHYRLKQLFSPW